MTGHGAHSHSHSHHHGGDVDWDAMADRLVLDAAIVMPIITAVLRGIDAERVQHVLDVGCGPGVVACALAQALPHAQVTAVDSNEPLLERAAHAAAAAGVGERVQTLRGDLDAGLDGAGMADLVWAGMVLHHVADPVATLQRLRQLLRPGGSLVMIEFGPVPTLHPADHPVQADGTWERFQQATSAVLTERLGLDPVTVDWPRHLAAAGFVDVHDGVRSARHEGPLTGAERAWFDAHVRRGVEMAAGRLDEHDVAALGHLADDPGVVAVTVHRRVVLARCD